MKAFSPAKTSSHSIFLFPSYAFSTAESKTRTAAFQISLPMPSPSINGIIGLSGTFKLPFSIEIVFDRLIYYFSLIDLFFDFTVLFVFLSTLESPNFSLGFDLSVFFFP